jgi:hypothetical protein
VHKKNREVNHFSKGGIMLELVLQKQREKKTLIITGIYFLIFLSIYTLLDYFNGGYITMARDFHPMLPYLQIFLNLIMSGISAVMMSFSTIFVKLSGNEGKGSFLSFISLVFGLLTYGCTPCVIAFFATIGITFAVAVLPLAGLPYKLISLLIVIIGLLWLIHEIKHPRCKVK